MEGQDEMTDILAESYPDNIKRTFAGISISGCMKMIDSYGMDGQNMADTWTVFGDPTVMVRTSAPTTLTVNHDTVLYTGDSTLLVTCDVDGARATITSGESIVATGLVVNDSLMLNFPALVNAGDTLRLVVTAYNTIPYQKDIVVDEVVILPVTAYFTGVPERVLPGETVAFSDTSAGTRASWQWMFPGGDPSQSTEQNPVVTYNERGVYDVTLIVGNGLTFDTLVKTEYITCDFAIGLPTTEAQPTLVTPNPSQGTFVISIPCEAGACRLDFFNVAGAKVTGSTIPSLLQPGETTIHAEALPQGIYFLKISGDSGYRTTGKVVLQ
jgi:gingipain R